MAGERLVVALVNQPWGEVVPPVRSGGSIPIILYELSRRLASRATVLNYNRAKFKPYHSLVEGVEYRYIPLAFDKLIMKLLARLPWAEDPFKPRFASTLAYIGYAVQVAMDLRRRRADVVHLTNLSQFAPIVRLFNPDAIIVLHMHCEWLSQLDRELVRRRIRHVDLIMGCSDFITERIRSQYPEFASRCATLHNGVDVEEFTERSTSPSQREHRKVVFVGRISPEKGVHTLLSAFAEVHSVFPDAELDIVGPDEINPPSLVVPFSDDPKLQELLPWYSSKVYRAVLDDLITPQLRGCVRFTGNIKHDATLADVYKAGDVCVIPSVWEEPFGMPVVEAMACGVPVIATRGGAFSEIIVDGETGLLVDRGNVASLADAIRRVLADGSLRERMGQAARKRVLEKFSWEHIEQVLANHYSQVIRDRGPVPQNSEYDPDEQLAARLGH